MKTVQGTDYIKCGENLSWITNTVSLKALVGAMGRNTTKTPDLLSPHKPCFAYLHVVKCISLSENTIV